MRAWVTILCWLWFVCLLVACAPKFEPVKLTGLPVRVSQPGVQEVDIDVVLADAKNHVQRILPKAYLVSFGFSGTCQELPQLRGKILLSFVEVRGILARQVLNAFVSVNTVSETMDLRIIDVSAYYLSTEPLTLEGLPVIEVAAAASEHIISLGLSQCDVGLSYLKEPSPFWVIECTPPGSGRLGRRLCEFEIDPFTGQVRGGNNGFPTM